MTTNKPVLFKRRVFYARFAAIFGILTILFTDPLFPESSLAHQAMRSSGIFLVIIGIMIRIYTSLYVGGKKNVELITNGTFSVVRNPLYVGSFMAVLGLGLTTGSIVLSCISALIFIMIHSYTILKEEAFLSETFGEDYRRYLHSVPRWLPNFSLWKYPQQIEVKPIFVLKTMRDSLVFIAIMVLIEILYKLRMNDQVSPLLVLP